MGGPSPRGWGELASVNQASHLDRTIPTRVGRTGIGSSERKAAPDHPHAGGENAKRGGILCRRAGPSPRGWGERFSSDFVQK